MTQPSIKAQEVVSDFEALQVKNKQSPNWKFLIKDLEEMTGGAR